MTGSFSMTRYGRHRGLSSNTGDTKRRCFRFRSLRSFAGEWSALDAVKEFGLASRDSGASAAPTSTKFSSSSRAMARFEPAI
jgi:hypothetical protein